MEMKEVKFLRDVRVNPTGKPGDYIEAKMGDVHEVAAKFVNDMVAAGSITLDLAEKVKKGKTDTLPGLETK